MPYLSRAWQMLLKGLEETARAPNPVAAAEMVLIRLAYMADLPSPDEIIRTLGGGAVPARVPGAAKPRDDGHAERGPLNTAPSQPAMTSLPQDDEDAFDGSQSDVSDIAEYEDEATPAHPSPTTQLRTFDDVIALTGLKRDAKLKMHLENHLSLVKFDAQAGSIDVFLLPGAPPELANDLREKLNSWTKRRWMVVLSKSAGAPSVGSIKREREALELESLQAHPAVKAVMEAFPDAKIAEVRPLAAIDSDADDESAAG